jgi:hypothetical protein
MGVAHESQSSSILPNTRDRSERSWRSVPTRATGKLTTAVRKEGNAARAVRSPAGDLGRRQPGGCMARVALVMFVVCVLSGSAAAQAVPSWMRVDTKVLGDHELTTLADASASLVWKLVPDAASQRRQNRARRFLAAGAGFVIAAAITSAYALSFRSVNRWGGREWWSDFESSRCSRVTRSHRRGRWRYLARTRVAS